MCYPVVIWGGG